MAGYGVGPNLLCLQKQFWDGARNVCHAGGSYGEPFSARQGVTQGGPLSSLMFSVCVDAVIREWLRQCLGDDTAWMGIGEAVHDHVVVFFVDNGLVVARCPEWLQSSFTILIHLFERISLKTNAAKMKVMTCLPGKIRVAKMEEEYAAQQTGNTTAAKRWRVDCEVCGISLALNLSEAIWRRSTTSFGRSSLIGTWLQSKPLLSTVLWNCLPPASTYARCRSVAAIPAPGSTYANIFLCNIPRISCASQSRVPSPCRSSHNVDCRRRSRTSPEVITAQRSVRGGGRGNANMRLLCIPNEPSNAHFMQTGRTWRGLKFLSTWVG